MDFNATVCAWTEEKEYLEWEVEFTESGEYACELVTSKVVGESTAQVEVFGQKLTRTISADTADAAFKLSRTGAENLRYTYNLGTVKVVAGKDSVFIRRIGDGANLPLAELKFRKL